MNPKHGACLRRRFVAERFLLLALGCGCESVQVSEGLPVDSGSEGGGSDVRNGGVSSDAEADASPRAPDSSSSASDGSTELANSESGSSLDSGGSPGTDAIAEGGQPNADANFVCPTMPVPGTCAPPVDIRCPYPKLSQTGCVDPTNPLKLASVVVPYEVNSPLWSDGALKTRGMRIPAGKTIHVKDCVKNPMECCVKDGLGGCLPPADDGKWILPVGTVMVKNFMFADTSQASGVKFVETRLFVHMDRVDPVSMSDWAGYAYQWNDAQTDATITSSSDPTMDVRSAVAFHVQPSAGAAIQSVNWHYPSRADCILCHKAITPTGGSTLGLETVQMNRIARGDTTNQIDKLAMLGLFDAAPAKPYNAALVAPYPGQAGSPPAGATLDMRARSYLHANCSFCHRPDGSDYNGIDLRYDVPFKGTHVCNAPPGRGDQGVPGALLLTPKSPMSSIVWLRMTAPPADVLTGNHGRMPQIATYTVDDSATTVVGDWINSIVACPQ